MGLPSRGLCKRVDQPTISENQNISQLLALLITKIGDLLKDPIGGADEHLCILPEMEGAGA